MTETEKLLKAKIPCAETGIEVKHTLCSICDPLFHCGINAYIKDGTVVKVEGTPGYPGSNGHLCPKGNSSREYIYRKDRIRTPLRRVGPRGSGEFEAISWDEAYRIIAENLNRIKAQYGPESVIFYSGYAKWYRSFLQRLCYDFGSPNFGTESSTCHMATVEAWKDMCGSFSVPDTRNAATYLAWACNPFHSKPNQAAGLFDAKERGQKIVVIDPRITPLVTQIADLHLRIKPGTDGALALGMGKLIIDNDWVDHDYVDHYVHGFDRYAEMVQKYDLDTVAKITDLNPADIEKATEWFATNKPSCISQSGAPIVHHRNGYQNFKAIMALTAITGNYDAVGGMMPIGETYSHQWANFETREHEFTHANRTDNCDLRIGYDRFPVWKAFLDEDQMTDFIRQSETKQPYELHAMAAFGLNDRMLPEANRIRKALDRMDFVMSTEIFMTEVCKHSDIVLPACTSFEREELRVYPGGWCNYVTPVIKPLYESRPDSQIIAELTAALGIDDPLLRSGYRECVRWMLGNCKLDFDAMVASDMPVMAPDAKPFAPRALSQAGFHTPTGKFELYSETIAAINRPDLNPLPDYETPDDGVDPEAYPFILSIGARLPFALHSRLHDVPWTRSLRPHPMADLNDEDAKRLGIAYDDVITLTSVTNSITVRANPTPMIKPGTVQMYHGYKEADANELVSCDHLDPYSGYPGYNFVHCKITKGGVEQ